MVKATIYSHELEIGTAILLPGDTLMGHVYGEFIVNEQYFKRAQDHIWKNNDNLSQADWQSLRLNIQLENGYFLFSVGGITIDDIRDLPDEPKRIDIAGIDYCFVEKFFTEEPHRGFLEEPWEAISIEQKIGFENELHKELGLSENKSGFFNDFLRSKQSEHVLSEYVVAALCTDGRNDDVLFFTRKKESKNQFAVVHLTWSGRKEATNWPATTFYKDFDDFKKTKMDIDVAEWNI